MRREGLEYQPFVDSLAGWEKALFGFSNRRVLDAGAGHGLFSRYMVENGNEVIGLELSDKLIAIARQNDIKMIEADLSTAWPVESSSFDVVVGRTVVEHLIDPWMFVAESYRVLKPGGQLIITTTNAANIMYRIRLLLGHVSLDHDLKHFSYANLTKVLLEAGFDRTSWFGATGRNFLLNPLRRGLKPIFSKSVIVVAVREGL